jgi:hypothetical protein
MLHCVENRRMEFLRTTGFLGIPFRAALLAVNLFERRLMTQHYAVNGT